MDYFCSLCEQEKPGSEFSSLVNEPGHCKACEQLMNLPSVAGRRIRGSNDDFERACLVHIERLQHGLGDYDSAMLDTFCEAVRIVREYNDAVKMATCKGGVQRALSQEGETVAENKKAKMNEQPEQKEHTWKYQIGDFVTPVVAGTYENPVKMVVTGRIIEEFADHTKHYYFCSLFRLGEFVRLSTIESEIVELKP